MSRYPSANPLLCQDRQRPRGTAGRPGAQPSAWPDPRPARPRYLSSGPDAAGQVTVTLSGDLDLTATPSLSRYLAQVLASQPRRLVIDLSRVGFIDCANSRLIAGAGRSLPGGRPVLRRPRPAVIRVLNLTGATARCEIAHEGANGGQTAKVTAE